MSLHSTGSRPVKGQYKRVTVSDIVIAFVIGLVIYAFASNRGGEPPPPAVKPATNSPAAEHPSIGACKDAIRAAVRQQKAADPIGTVDPESANLFSIYGGELIKTAQGFLYRISVNDTYASNSTKYTCITSDAGVVTNIEHQ